MGTKASLPPKGVGGPRKGRGRGLSLARSLGITRVSLVTTTSAALFIGAWLLLASDTNPYRFIYLV